MMSNKRRDKNEFTLHGYRKQTQFMGRIDPFVAIYTIVATLLYGITPSAIFAVIVVIADIYAGTEVDAQLKRAPPVKPWMLKKGARLSTPAQLRRLLLSIAGTATKHVEEAIGLLAEGSLERTSEAELMDLVVAESSRIMHLARDLSRQLRKRDANVESNRQRQPSELLLLLRSAVRFPRVAKGHYDSD